MNQKCKPCPSCFEPNRLTAEDGKLGYQCVECCEIDARNADHAWLYGATDV